MRIIHTVPSIAKEASGPSYSVSRLCGALVEQGQDVTLAALDWAPMAMPPPFLNTFPLGLGPRRLGRSPEMARWLNNQAATSKVSLIHNHGMWQMNAIYPARTAKRFQVPYVVSPRGCFTEYAMSIGSPVKKMFWPLVQRPALQAVSLFHATADSELTDIRRLGYRQPVAVIPNGIDLPPLQEKVTGDMRTLLFLGRIDPNKGFDMLLPAWRAVQARFPEWRLRIVGSDIGYNGQSGYLSTLQTMASDLGLKRIEFSGELLGMAKLQAYREAELFVLPSYSENFGMTVAESLAAGTPAIVSKGAPWSGLNSEGGGVWIEIGVEPLVGALENFLSRSPSDLVNEGLFGREWMERDFSWKKIGHDMTEVYAWLTGQNTTLPDCIKLT